jgi:hypothetical protein
MPDVASPGHFSFEVFPFAVGLQRKSFRRQHEEIAMADGERPVNNGVNVEALLVGRFN